MCGIFGVALDGDAGFPDGFRDRALRILARESQSRGKDSSGLVVHDPRADAYQVFKGAIPLNVLLASDAVSGFLQELQMPVGNRVSLAIGHSRLVTNGSQLTDANNQPVIKDGIIGIHNGIIVNDTALWVANPQLSRDFEIDTEVFLALVRFHLQAGASVQDAIRRTAAVIEGTVSTALIMPERRILALFTDNGSLYVLTDGVRALFFASEYHPLKVLAEQLSLDTSQGYKLSQVTSRTGLLVFLDKLSISHFDALRDENARPTSVADAKTSIRVRNISDGRSQLELVRDVADIARAAEAAKFESLLEYHHDRVARLRRCTKCLLPETFPFVEYDAAGVCNYCRHYKIRNQPKPWEQLLSLVEPYRSREALPDCIVPFSGGRDSTYALHVIKTKLRLNPIAFTYDWGMVTDLGRRNIARVCGKLGVENIIVAADIHWKRRNIHKNIMAWLRKPHPGMIP